MNLANLNQISILIYLILFIVKTDSKIGRGGGGFRGSSGSRFGSKNNIGMKPQIPFKQNQPSFNRYGNVFASSRSGIRWSSFGAGMVAYGLMSSLVSRGHYHSGYYHRHESSYSRRGSVCINNEDFNGTKFGSFNCPLPGFDPSARYCCGSAENQTQFCCEFFDDESRKNGVIIAIVCIVGILVCAIGLTYRICLVLKKKQRLMKFNGPSYPQPQMNLRNVNRNINNMRPGQQPIYNQFGNNFNRTEGTPFIANNLNAYDPTKNLPYPTHQTTMPTPMIVPSITLTSPPENYPPSYSDAIKPN